MGLLMSDQGGVWGSGESSSSDHHGRLSPSCRRNSHSLIIVEPYCSNLCTAHQVHLTLVSCRLTLHRLLRPRSSVFLEPCLGLICIAEPSSPESVIRTQHLAQKDTRAHQSRERMDPHSNIHATATPLEMGSLPHEQARPSMEPPQPSFVTAPTEAHVEAPQITDRREQFTRSQFIDEGTDPLPPTPLEMPAPALIRQETAEPIGPSTDLPTPMPQTPGFGTPSGPVITINLLLSSTGTRHPYRIDQKYLAKRNVTANNENGEFDPFVISVYTLKELIWRDWREGTFCRVVQQPITDQFIQNGSPDPHPQPLFV